MSSPGIERPLRREQDFARFTGQKAKLKLREAVNGQRVLVGVLGGTTGGDAGMVRVMDGQRTFEVPLTSVESAHLVFEFGSPGKASTHPAGKKSHKQSRH